MARPVVLLTGATEGIGKAAARRLAPDHHLVLVGRNPEKTARVADEVRAVPGAEVSTLLGDLSLMSGVRGVAEAFLSSFDRLDVLANNAGAVFEAYEETAEGYERSFALNHLSYFLLTALVRERLRPGARVVCTSSGAHRGSTRPVADWPRPASRIANFAAYGDSKLANILFVREAARRLPGVEVNAYHPGWVGTQFGGNNPGLFGSIITRSANLLARTPDKGAETLVWLATHDAGATGEYFMDKKVARRTARARNDEMARELWALSEKITGVSWPA